MNKKAFNSFYRDSKKKKIVKLLLSKGFEYVGGSKHDKYERLSDDHTMVIPRHRKISPPTTKSICEDLRELHGFTEEEINSIF